MILIELGPDDFDRHGFAIIGCVVSAIAKVIQSDGGLNRFQAERHEGLDKALLLRRADVYDAAKKERSER